MVRLVVLVAGPALLLAALAATIVLHGGLEAGAAAVAVVAWVVCLAGFMALLASGDRGPGPRGA